MSWICRICNQEFDDLAKSFANHQLCPVCANSMDKDEREFMKSQLWSEDALDLIARLRKENEDDHDSTIPE